jgi:WXG100 family type VII secretion target
MQGISITPAEVRGSAGRIANTNRALEETLNNIKKEVNALSGAWQSKSADTTQQVFNAHAAKFAEYRAYIDSYTKFLEAAATAYDDAEKSVDTSAASFGA